MYKLRLIMMIVLCYLQMIYELDVFLPMCAVAFGIERYLSFIVRSNSIV
jgi:hypothetical protein